MAAAVELSTPPLMAIATAPGGKGTGWIGCGADAGAAQADSIWISAGIDNLFSHGVETAFTECGESARRRSTAGGITEIARSISASVVKRPRLKRKLLRASSRERPI